MFGKEIEEFEIPEDIDDDVQELDNLNQVDHNNEIEQKIEKTSQVKIPFKIKSIVEESFDNLTNEDDESDDELMRRYKDIKIEDEENEEDYDNDLEADNKEEVEEEFDIFGDKYRDISFSQNDRNLKRIKEEVSKEIIHESDNHYEEKDENFLEEVKQLRRKSKKYKSNEIEDIALTEDATKKSGLLRKMRKITSVKKNLADDLW